MLYLFEGISRQAHAKSVNRIKQCLNLETCYIGFMAEIRKIHPGMGLRKMYEQFNPTGIGRDAFIFLGLQHGYRLGFKRNASRTTYSIKSNRYKNLLAKKKFTKVNQLWVSDITYYSFNGRHFYIVLLMDVYSRRILGYSISKNMKAENNIKALMMAITTRGETDYDHELIHHSDRGSQYVSNDYTNLLEDSNILISMCNNVYENTHCERVNSTIKNEYLDRWDAKNERQLYKNVDKAIANYNNRRHNSLKMTPLQYEAFLESIEPNQRIRMEIYTERIEPFNNNQIAFQFD